MASDQLIRRRILVVTTWFPSVNRPTEAPFNLKHVEAISLHHDVEVVHVRLNDSSPPLSEIYEGVTVQRISFDPRRPWHAVGVIRRLRGALKRADLLHSMAFSSALVCAPAAAVVKIPWVHTEHWNGVVNPASVSSLWERLAWSRYILRMPSWLTGVTGQLTDTLAKFGRPETSSVVPCVVENPLPIIERSNDRPLRLVAVGGMVARKRPMLALQTLEWLTSNGHDVILDWVGDGPERTAVAQASQQLGLSDRFLISGSVRPEAVFLHYQNADLFYLPSEQENFFTSAAEALSAGRPVVTGRVGGYEDYIDDSNSVLVDDPTPENFGRAILHAQEKFRGTPAAVIAAPIRDRFALARVAGQFDAIYDSLLRTRTSK